MTQTAVDRTLADRIEVALMARPGSRKSGPEVYYRCFDHGDGRASASYNVDKGTAFCQVCKADGWGLKYMAEKLGIPLEPRRNGHHPQARMVVTYGYRDPNGILVFEVVRKDPKDFLQRRPDGHGGWMWNLDGVSLIPYRLPELLAAGPDELVFIVEGEKDVETLRLQGLVATTNPGGAGKWRPEYSEHLRGRPVCIVPDNDPAGRQHAEHVARALRGIAAGVKVLDLEGLPEKGDVSNWLQRDHSVDELLDLARRAPEWEPTSPVRAGGASDPSCTAKPTILASCQELPVITEQCWNAIRAANQPPRYFRHGGIPCRVESDDQGTLVVRELTPDRLRHEIARLANWVIRKEAKDAETGETTSVEIPAKPPLDVVKDVLATPDPPLPVLRRIVEAPVFAADGTLQTASGYHAGSESYHAPAKGLTIPAVPDSPTTDDISRAKGMIDEMISDFPFVGEADRSHAIALYIQPFVRDLIDGPTPLHGIEASTAGCGKGLLVQALLAPSVGWHVGMVPEARDDAELAKRLTAQLREAKAAIVLDNISRSVDSPALASALTARTWEDRILGRSETVTLPVRCAWVMTANNPTMSTEIARRYVRTRLDPMVDRPWLRQGFRHPDLLAWVNENRGAIVWAALTLATAWLAAGRPRPRVRPLGSYEQWSMVIGGILETVGIPGFLSNLQEFYEIADADGAIWREFVAAWWAKFRENDVGTSELFPLATECDCFDLGRGGERSQRVTFGKLLSGQRDRVIGEYRIVMAGRARRASRWRLLPIAGDLLRGVNMVNMGECSSTPLTLEADGHTSVNLYREEAPNIHPYSQHSPDREEGEI